MEIPPHIQKLEADYRRLPSYRFMSANYQPTELEKTLIKYASMRACGTRNELTVEWSMRRISGLEQTVDSYLNILESARLCPLKGKYGASAVNTNTEESTTQEERGRMLTELTEMGILEPTSMVMREIKMVEVYDIEKSSTVPIAQHKPKQKTLYPSTSYKLTDWGEQLLQAHKKVKQEGK